MKFPSTELPILTNTTRDFVTENEQLKSIIGAAHPFYSIEKAIELKKGQCDRSTLVKVLNRCYEPIFKGHSNDDAVKNNIQLLANENTFTVTTGQQLHLFFGPAFVMYKIRSIIDTAKQLKIEYPQYNFVPVYWMAGEDHDFEEIKNTHVFNKTFTWNTDQQGACGRFHLNEVPELIQSIKDSVNMDEAQKELLQVFEDIYQQSKSLAEASAKCIHHFFGDEGVIAIDGDHTEFKSNIREMIKADVLDSANIAEFNQISEELEKNAYHIQLHARAINFFYLKEGLRKRIINENQIFKVVDTDIQFTRTEMLNEIETHPEHFSPNAVLRPVFQEFILPNCMYIGGNAEVNYWIQIKTLFEKNGTNAPVLKLRPNMWIIPQKIAEKLQKKDISEKSVLLAENDSELLGLLGGENEGVVELIESFEALRKRIQDTAAQYFSPELKGLIEQGKMYERQLKQLDKFVKEKSIEKNKVEFDKIKSIRDTYLNLNKIQERSIDSLEMLIKYGNPFLNHLKGVEFANSLVLFLHL